ncbi:hypothetical protein E2C01_002443 [Portunus trituberculatus]|uniref:Uncharacterized protein n=1 Tax=Portunus trituberculatus TaxID=210409 RepID=A0A5B7CKK8_PORTR|nr:hypothetical protein [Portunus trituberculatus]
MEAIHQHHYTSLIRANSSSTPQTSVKSSHPPPSLHPLVHFTHKHINVLKSKQLTDFPTPKCLVPTPAPPSPPRPSHHRQSLQASCGIERHRRSNFQNTHLTSEPSFDVEIQAYFTFYTLRT